MSKDEIKRGEWDSCIMPSLQRLHVNNELCEPDNMIDVTNVIKSREKIRQFQRKKLETKHSTFVWSLGGSLPVISHVIFLSLIQRSFPHSLFFVAPSIPYHYQHISNSSFNIISSNKLRKLPSHFFHPISLLARSLLRIFCYLHVSFVVFNSIPKHSATDTFLHISLQFIHTHKLQWCLLHFISESSVNYNFRPVSSLVSSLCLLHWSLLINLTCVFHHLLILALHFNRKLPFRSRPQIPGVVTNSPVAPSIVPTTSFVWGQNVNSS